MPEPVACGKYELLERLGDGGMAEVFKARLPGAAGFERIVVIKRMLPHLARRSYAVNMFVAEAKLAAQIHHRNIVQVHELVELEDDDFFMVMEYVEGVDLRRLLSVATKAKKRVPPWFSVFALAEILDGLAYVHELADENGVPRGIVHRDVSPSNVFVSTQGEIKLGDFGVAKDPTQDSETRTGQLKGKVGYMAPEQLRGKGVDARSDLFAAGAVLWECLAQRRLFGGRPDLEAMTLICDPMRVGPSTFRSDIPPELDAIVLSAIAVDPAKRPPSARAMQAALLQVLPSLHSAASPIEVRRLVNSLRNHEPSAFELEPIDTSSYTDPFGSAGGTPSAKRRSAKTRTRKPDTIMDLSFAGEETATESEAIAPSEGEGEGEGEGDQPDWLVSGQEMNRYEGDFADLTEQRWTAYRTVGGEYDGPLPYWVDDGAGHAFGPCELDRAISTIRSELAIEPSSELRISADGESWIAVSEFAELTGQDALLRPLDEPVDASARTVGELGVDSLVRIVYDLGAESVDGQLIVWTSGSARRARTEIHLERGKPTYVYTDQDQLQLPAFVVAKGLTTNRALPALFHRVVSEQRPLIELADEQNQVDRSRFGVVLMKERLTDVFRWTAGRVALDTTSAPKRKESLYPSLRRLLPEAVLRGSEIPWLRARLAASMNAKLRAAPDFRAALDGLGLSAMQIEIAERLAKTKKIATVLQSTKGQERTIRGVAALLLEVGLLVA